MQIDLIAAFGADDRLASSHFVRLLDATSSACLQIYVRMKGEMKGPALTKYAYAMSVI